MRFTGPAGIGPFVERFLRSNRDRFAGKVVVDVPAGSGHMSRLLQSLGARVEPLDLFPEHFRVEGLECRKADLSERIPLESDHADYILSQEGIEHVPNQVGMFREFNRILKKGGGLIITTPNYSNLRIKLGQLLAESEYAVKRLPPNELDSIWGRGGADRVYFGHVFPVGIQKLRFLARVAGFGITEIHRTRVNGTSLALLPFLYPFILVVNWLAYMRAMYKGAGVPAGVAGDIYGEILGYGIDPQILIDGYLFVEFRKLHDLSKAFSLLKVRRGGSVR